MEVHGEASGGLLDPTDPSGPLPGPLTLHYLIPKPYDQTPPTI